MCRIVFKEKKHKLPFTFRILEYTSVPRGSITLFHRPWKLQRVKLSDVGFCSVQIFPKADMNSLTLNLINMFSTLFPVSCLNDCLPEEFLWDQIHGPMLARIWTSDCIRGFPYEPSILSLVYVSKKCSIIGVNLRLFMRPTLCILCELTSECLYSASAEWCPAAVAVYYVCSWSAFATGVSTERSQVSMLQHHFSMWTIAWERVMSGEIALKSMFLIQTKMLDRWNCINGGGRCLRSLPLHPAGPFPPCWITCT